MATGLTAGTTTMHDGNEYALVNMDRLMMWADIYRGLIVENVEAGDDETANYYSIKLDTLLEAVDYVWDIVKKRPVPKAEYFQDLDYKYHEIIDGPRT